MYLRLLVCTFLISGCADEIQPTLELDELDDATLLRLIGASTGRDARMAMDVATRLLQSTIDVEDTCPTLHRVGRTSIMFSDCKNRFGVGLSGAIRISQWTSRSTFEFLDFTIDDPEGDVIPNFMRSMSIDGSISVSGDLTSDFRLTTDVVVELDGRQPPIRSAIVMACQEGRCGLSDGVELEGNGAVIENANSVGRESSWTLRGVSRLEVAAFKPAPFNLFGDFCVAWQIPDSGRSGGSPCPRSPD